jgi:hypothetical protein
MADTKLSALSQGTLPDLYYGDDQSGNSKKFKQLRVFNVLDYGADPTFTNDSAAAINNAIADMYATALHGATVYVPYGHYKVLSPISLAGSSGFTGRVQGAGMNSTIIEAPNGAIPKDFAMVGNFGNNMVQEICDLNIVNGSQTIGSGALVYCEEVASLRNVSLSGMVSLICWSTNMSMTGLHTDSPILTGSVGIAGGGFGLNGWRTAGGHEYAMMVAGTGGGFATNMTVEECPNGAILGYRMYCATDCTISGGVLTVGGSIYPNDPGSNPFSVGSQIIATGIPAATIVTISSFGTGDGSGTGTYNLSGAGGITLSTPQAITSRISAPLSGFKFGEYNTEGVGVGVNLNKVSCCTIGPLTLTGTINEAASTAGGSKTTTSSCAMFIQNAADSVIECINAGVNCAQACILFSNSLFAKDLTIQSCQSNFTSNAVTGTTAFIDNGAGAGSPSGVAGHILTVKAALTNTIGIGGYVTGAGVGTNPAPLIDSQVGFPSGTYQANGGGANTQYVLKNTDGSSPSLNITGVAFTINHGVAWGVRGTGTGGITGDLTTMDGNMKAGIQILNSNNPSGPNLSMHFSNLPGQSGVQLTFAIEGMQYDIVDANTTTFGATVSSGGGSSHVRVRYNGTNWTVCGA